jgi:uncharacterized protein
VTGPTPPPPSAADLSGHDLGTGRIALSWTYPLDPVAQGIVFDVRSGTDPLDPFRVERLVGHPSTAAEIGGFDTGGEHYLSVVARRGTVAALPSRLLRLSVRAVRANVPLSPATAAPGPVGLAFPFGVDGAGRVRAEGGDPLLRGRILQLLLTSPGERVNLPGYGTRLRDLVFDPNDDILAATTEFTVARALNRFLGDAIKVDRVHVSTVENELTVDIVYLRTDDLRTERLRIGVPIPTFARG